MTKDLLIVAAGMGTRLRAKGNLKPLVELCGIPLIERALESAFAAGLTRAVVVTGYHSEILESFLEGLSKDTGWHIETIHNPDFMYPNGLSVLKAAEKLSENFVLSMCDHFLEPALIKQLVSTGKKPGEIALAVDGKLNNPYVDLEDVTKVCTKGRYITNIGKEIPLYNAFDTGVFHAGPALFEAIEKSGRDRNDYSISGGMLELAEENKAVTVDVSEHFWIDVDSPEMHELATKWLNSNQPLVASR